MYHYRLHIKTQTGGPLCFLEFRVGGIDVWR
jgi:hypothetical protein